MTQRAICGPAHIVRGDLGADAILSPRDQGVTAPEDLACLCLDGALASKRGGAILIVCGRFATGLPRPPLAAALRAAGIEAIVAQAFSPIFVEIALNTGGPLPIVAALPALPDDDAKTAISLDGKTAEIAFSGYRSRVAAPLPEWALEGRGWIAEIERRAEAAGGLEALRRRSV